MSERIKNDGPRRLISRRGFFALGGGAVVAIAAGGAYAAGNGDQDPAPRGKVPAGLNPANGGPNVKKLALAVTDGSAGMPRTLPAIAPYFPDTNIYDGSAESLDTYIFGFRDVTGLERSQVQAQQGKAQISAPVIDCTVGEELWVTLSNLGLLTRPDLTDSHTMHWHGFRNAIPFYDGVPESSVSVPTGRDFTYVFRPRDAGTYMYHCHFEDVEHVTMGMTGLVFVRPSTYVADDPGTWTAYAAADTAYDVEYPILLTEFDFSGHWNDGHIMESDWTNYKPDIWLMNGRAFPDTLEPSSARDDTTGDMEVPAAAHLQYQPISSKLTAAPGERVLIRLANLGFQEQTLSMPGVPLRMVGNDARYMSPDQQTIGDTVVLGPGESRDLILTAPAAAGIYPFYNTDPTKYRGDGSDQRVGGQYTELHVV